MTPHLTDFQIRQFLDGSLSEQEAAAIALHLDSCPECLNRVTLAEPLHTAFASTLDPVVPLDLAESILESIEASHKTPWTEIMVGGALLASASLIFLATLEPVDTFVQSAIWLKTLTHASQVLTANITNSIIAALLLAGAFALTSCVFMQTIMVQRRLRT